jgi:hypothetical protein
MRVLDGTRDNPTPKLKKRIAVSARHLLLFERPVPAFICHLIDVVVHRSSFPEAVNDDLSVVRSRPTTGSVFGEAF